MIFFAGSFSLSLGECTIIRYDLSRRRKKGKPPFSPNSDLPFYRTVFITLQIISFTKWVGKLLFEKLVQRSVFWINPFDELIHVHRYGNGMIALICACKGTIHCKSLIGVKPSGTVPV